MAIPGGEGDQIERHAQNVFGPRTQFMQFPARYPVTSQIDNPVEVGLAESHEQADSNLLSRTLFRLFAQQDSKVAFMKQSLCCRAGLSRKCSIRDMMKTMRHLCMWPHRNFALSQPARAVAVLFQATAHSDLRNTCTILSAARPSHNSGRRPAFPRPARIS